MRELFHKYGCEAKWLFFVDADSVMVDLTRSLESIISFANHQYYPAGGGEGCEVVAQLSSSTINTGVIFFRISPAGDKLVRTWISTYMKNQAMGRKWQDEQVVYVSRLSSICGTFSHLAFIYVVWYIYYIPTYIHTRICTLLYFIFLL